MVLTFGEIMLRLSAEGNERFTQAKTYSANYGGSEANVAVSLAVMGERTAHATIFPENALGQTAKSELQKCGVSTDFVFFQEGRMGLYFLENGAMQRSSRIIYDRFDSAFANLKVEQFDWEKILENVSWFHWTGITPAISANAAKCLLKALEVCERREIKVSGDINYRRNLWNYGKDPMEVMPELIGKTNMIIAGLTDFDNCLGIKSESWEEAVQTAVEKYPSINSVACTERESKSASENSLKGILWNEGKTYSSREFEISHIVDRIGGGDAFMAGLIYGLIHFKDYQEIVEYATAASVLKHSIKGDVNLVTSEEIMQVVKNQNVGKLLR